DPPYQCDSMPALMLQTASVPTAAPSSSRPRHVLSSERGWLNLDLGELWRYRELLFFLTWRDIKVRYKQTVLGAAWALIQPLLTMVIFTVIFGKIAKLPSQ